MQLVNVATSWLCVLLFDVRVILFVEVWTAQRSEIEFRASIPSRAEEVELTGAKSRALSRLNAWLQSATSGKLRYPTHKTGSSHTPRGQ